MRPRGDFRFPLDDLIEGPGNYWRATSQVLLKNGEIGFCLASLRRSYSQALSNDFTPELFAYSAAEEKSAPLHVP